MGASMSGTDIDERLRQIEQSIRGDVVHTAMVSRWWAAAGALAAIVFFGIQIGSYKKAVDDALDQIPAIQTKQAVLERRVTYLESIVGQGRSGQTLVKEPPQDNLELASGQY